MKAAGRWSAPHAGGAAGVAQLPRPSQPALASCREGACLKSIVQRPSQCVWKSMGPWVESAVKLGTSSPSTTMMAADRWVGVCREGRLL